MIYKGKACEIVLTPSRKTGPVFGEEVNIESPYGLTLITRRRRPIIFWAHHPETNM